MTAWVGPQCLWCDQEIPAPTSAPTRSPQLAAALLEWSQDCPRALCSDCQRSLEGTIRGEIQAVFAALDRRPDPRAVAHHTWFTKAAFDGPDALRRAMADFLSAETPKLTLEAARRLAVAQARKSRDGFAPLTHREMKCALRGINRGGRAVIALLRAGWIRDEFTRRRGDDHHLVHLVIKQFRRDPTIGAGS